MPTILKTTYIEMTHKCIFSSGDFSEFYICKSNHQSNISWTSQKTPQTQHVQTLCSWVSLPPSITAHIISPGSPSPIFNLLPYQKPGLCPLLLLINATSSTCLKFMYISSLPKLLRFVHATIISFLTFYNNLLSCLPAPISPLQTLHASVRVSFWKWSWQSLA